MHLLNDEKEDLLKTIKQKEARIKTVMIKLEYATQDVSSVGHKIAVKDKEITKLHKFVCFNVFFRMQGLWFGMKNTSHHYFL